MIDGSELGAYSYFRSIYQHFEFMMHDSTLWVEELTVGIMHAPPVNPLGRRLLQLGSLLRFC